jgi:hypothetical protein
MRFPVALCVFAGGCDSLVGVILRGEWDKGYIGNLVDGLATNLGDLLAARDGYEEEGSRDFEEADDAMLDMSEWIGSVLPRDCYRFQRRWRSVLLATVLEQRANIALVVDFDSLLRRRRLVARWRRLKDEPVNRRKDEKLADQTGHAASA